MPLQETSGNLTTDAFGGGVAAVPAYIEDVFSTYLYTGNGSTQTITNNIDLSTKGGLVWVKDRGATNPHVLEDTIRGVNQRLSSDTTDAQTNAGNPTVSAFNTTGFSIGQSLYVNNTSDTYASWTWRKQPKFFDVVTYTGTGSAQNIPHNLGSVPGCIIIKNITNVTNWAVYHRSLTGTNRILLNLTAASAAGSTYWNNTDPTSTVFTVNTVDAVNTSSDQYVAYLFAHDAGGFGLTGTDNVISCGSFTADGGGSATVSLGYEPQWVMVKSSSTTGAWLIFDTMRGLPVTGSNCLRLSANANTIEASGTQCYINSTGFGVNLQASITYIYIAIRRGPMKVPTDATKVFAPTATSATTGTKITTGFVTDLQMANYRSGAGSNTVFTDRLRGISNTSAASPTVGSANTNAEITTIDYLYAADNTGWKQGSFSSGGDSIRYDFLRAPSFFDEVCYTGNGAGTRAINHNLGVTPTFMIEKPRNSSSGWAVYCSELTYTKYLFLNSTAAADTNSNFWGAEPTSSTFSVGAYRNDAGPPAEPYVVYLFATCAGVSKVGSYTGNGTTQTINCGFTGGARFVLIKRTDSTGDWYTYDTARGMTTLTDPYLLLNSTAAEVATLGSVTTVSTGFALNSTILAAINISSATYIFLAIA